jgi:hypothetical protein
VHEWPGLVTKLPQSNNIPVYKQRCGCKFTCYGNGNKGPIKPNFPKIHKGGPKTNKASESDNAPVAKRERKPLAAWKRVKPDDIKTPYIDDKN